MFKPVSWPMHEMGNVYITCCVSSVQSIMIPKRSHMNASHVKQWPKDHLQRPLVLFLPGSFLYMHQIRTLYACILNCILNMRSTFFSWNFSFISTKLENEAIQHRPGSVTCLDLDKNPAVRAALESFYTRLMVSQQSVIKRGCSLKPRGNWIFMAAHQIQLKVWEVDGETG